MCYTLVTVLQHSQFLHGDHFLISESRGLRTKSNLSIAVHSKQFSESRSKQSVLASAAKSRLADGPPAVQVHPDHLEEVISQYEKLGVLSFRGILVDASAGRR